MTDVCIIIAIAAYLIGMICIGIRFSNQNKTSEDFYLGGRKMGPLVVAMSAEASDMSSWLLMGLPGVAYLSGVCSAFWTAAGRAIGAELVLCCQTSPPLFQQYQGDHRSGFPCKAFS